MHTYSDIHYDHGSLVWYITVTAYKLNIVSAHSIFKFNVTLQIHKWTALTILFNFHLSSGQVHRKSTLYLSVTKIPVVTNTPL